MGIQIRPVSKDAIPTMVKIFQVAIGELSSELEDAALVGYAEGCVNIGAFDGDRLVGSTSHWTTELTLPGGGTVEAGAVTLVGVLPTHRRRGAADGLMREQLQQLKDTGHAAAILEASEVPIYGRWGYGVSTRHLNAAIQTQHGAFNRDLEDDGSFDFADGPEAVAHFANPIVEACRPTRPGSMSRPAHWWAMSLFDPPGWREGAGPEQAIFHVDKDGNPDGFARYRITTRWDAGLPASEVGVEDVVAPDPNVQALIWRFLLDMDVMAFVSIDGLAPDDPLWYLLTDHRRLRITEDRDGLWTRILDVPGALQARSWDRDDELTLTVADPILDDCDGTWALRVKDGQAEVSRADTTPDVTLGIDSLSALWLGGISARALANAGRLSARDDETLRRLTHLFAHDIAPLRGASF